MDHPKKWSLSSPHHFTLETQRPNARLCILYSQKALMHFVQSEESGYDTAPACFWWLKSLPHEENAALDAHKP